MFLLLTDNAVFEQVSYDDDVDYDTRRERHTMKPQVYSSSLVSVSNNLICVKTSILPQTLYMCRTHVIGNVTYWSVPYKLSLQTCCVLINSTYCEMEFFAWRIFFNQACCKIFVLIYVVQNCFNLFVIQSNQECLHSILFATYLSQLDCKYFQFAKNSPRYTPFESDSWIPPIGLGCLSLVD